jgi:NAD(P)-dependent dehydrogenase (short-subunit alcohol dehydrogenase family)
MNILFTRELARRLPASVTVNCVHPGFVATRFGGDNPVQCGAG